jgi:CRP/FNR family cyclic AMP-dependent transcriptional regulator
MATDRSDRGVPRPNLAGHPLFGALPERDLDALIRNARTQRFARGTTIFSKGDDGSSMMQVLSGTIKIASVTADGKEVVLNLIGTGQVFGEIALLDGRPRTADATALSDCDVMVVERRDFLPLLRANPDLALRIVVMLCARLRRTNEQVESIMYMPLEARLARTLLRLSAEQGAAAPGKAVRKVAVTQRDLGQMIGMSRESTNKQLMEWQRDGLVSIVRGGVELRDTRALAAAAEGI